MVIPVTVFFAFFTASCTCFPYIPLPPNSGNRAGCMLMILSGYFRIRDGGTSHKNPANTICVIPLPESKSDTVPVSESSRFVKTQERIPWAAATSRTPALLLLLSTHSIFTDGWFLKYSIICWAFDPLPEAKMAILAMSIGVYKDSFLPFYLEGLQNPLLLFKIQSLCNGYLIQSVIFLFGPLSALKP